MKAEICNAKGWDTLSVSENGEAVLGYRSEDVFVTAKVRTFSDIVSFSDVYKAYLKRLEDEASIVKIDNSMTMVGSTLWTLNLITLENQITQYVLYASAIVNGYTNVIEAMLPTAGDYIAFMKQFGTFCDSIDFTLVTKEIGYLECDGAKISVMGISDVILQPNEGEDVLLFVGKDKYFSVSVSDDSQRSTLESSGYKVESLVFENGIMTERFKVKDDRSGYTTGVLELSSRKVGNKYVEIFGYFFFDTESCIENNIKLDIKEASV